MALLSFAFCIRAWISNDISSFAYDAAINCRKCWYATWSRRSNWTCHLVDAPAQ